MHFVWNQCSSRLYQLGWWLTKESMRSQTEQVQRTDGISQKQEYRSTDLSCYCLLVLYTKTLSQTLTKFLLRGQNAKLWLNCSLSNISCWPKSFIISTSKIEEVIISLEKPKHFDNEYNNKIPTVLGLLPDIRCKLKIRSSYNKVFLIKKKKTG